MGTATKDYRRLLKAAKAVIVADNHLSKFNANNVRIRTISRRILGMSPPYMILAPAGRTGAGHGGNVTDKTIHFTVTVFQAIIDDIDEQSTLVTDDLGLIDLGDYIENLFNHKPLILSPVVAQSVIMWTDETFGSAANEDGSLFLDFVEEKFFANLVTAGVDV